MCLSILLVCFRNIHTCTSACIWAILGNLFYLIPLFLSFPLCSGVSVVWSRLSLLILLCVKMLQHPHGFLWAPERLIRVCVLWNMEGKLFPGQALSRETQLLCWPWRGRVCRQSSSTSPTFKGVLVSSLPAKPNICIFPVPALPAHQLFLSGRSSASFFYIFNPPRHSWMLFLCKYRKLTDNEVVCFWKAGYFNKLFTLSVFIPEGFWHRNENSVNSTQKQKLSTFVCFKIFSFYVTH